MAVTLSRTQTKTFARSELLKWQLLVALQRTVFLREETKHRLSQAIDRQWVKAAHVFALNAEGQCAGKLTLEVDWEQYQIQVYRGKGVVTIDGSWIDRTAMEVDEALNIFDEWVREHKLTTRYAIETPTPTEGTDLSRFLGFIPAQEPQWAGDRHGTTLTNRDLSELTVGCYFAED